MFGGSFDPVHNAHLIVARLACEQLELDRIHFVVAASQPLKHGIHHARAEERFRMVQLAVHGIPDFVADDRELRRAPPSYTVDTLREFAAAEPDAELFLILGADAVARLDEWREPAAIRGLATLVIANRRGITGGGAAHPVSGATLAMPLLEISSSAVRVRAVAGLSLAGWVPSAVADYIVASQVYVE